MLAARISEVRDKIADACLRAGRSPEDVQLVSVTKNHPRDVVELAIAAGLRVFGENRVQEAVQKYDGIDDVELRLIGHLQSNKAKFVPSFFSWVESIDSLSIARALSGRLDSAGAECSVLLQFNSTGESTKSGFADETALIDAAGEMCEMPGISLRGVMTIGPFTTDTPRISQAFDRTRKLFDQLRKVLPESRIDTLSMGMTDDLEIAIAEGSTEVRVGTALFGSRDQ